MLDVISNTSTRPLSCALMPQLRLLLQTNVPIQGHDGQEFPDQTPFVHYRDVKDEHFYEIFSNCKKGDELRYAFDRHIFLGSDLSHQLPLTACSIPDLGFEPGQVVWVSRESIRHYGTKWREELSRVLINKAKRKQVLV